jgi:hypothetical protein
MKLIYVFYFFISFCIGCVFLYFSPIEHKTVLVYPTPDNISKIQYKDSANQCFNFSAKIVSCKGDIKEIPIQHHE